MRKLSVHLRIHFDDMMAEDSDAAFDAVKQALMEMHDQCESKLADALEAIGARDVRIEMVVY